MTAEGKEITYVKAQVPDEERVFLLSVTETDARVRIWGMLVDSAFCMREGIRKRMKLKCRRWRRSCWRKMWNCVRRMM